MNLETLQDRIRDAAARTTPLRLRGGGSKDFYGNELRGEVVDTRDYCGIASYEPTELVLTARCGTPLVEVESILNEKAQCLPFEPPHFGPGATFGGCVAAGLSGPRRASAGALRDFVLGVKLIDGRGRLMSFGGQVMKNVAGYDVARLAAGSLGTLGLIAEASLKVLPRPACELTLELEMSESAALDCMNLWAGQPLPVSASAWHGGRLHIRLSGAEPGVRTAAKRIGGERREGDLWRSVREHTHGFFSGPEPLWRLAVPSSTPALGLPGDTLIEWGGGQRWTRGHTADHDPRETARRAGGHATLFRSATRKFPCFTPLEPALMDLHHRLKSAFDPAGILNPGRMYPEL